MDLKDKIKKKRKDEGLSVPKLALVLGLNPENIYKWEKGTLPKNPIEYNTILSWLEEVPGESGKAAAQDPRISRILDQQNRLLDSLQQHSETSNRILKRIADEVEVRVKKIDANLTDALGRVDGLQYDLVSGRQVVLESLARLEGKPEKHLLKQADSIKRELHVSLQKQNKSAGKGK